MPHRWVRRSINNDDLIEAIDLFMDRSAECQLLVDSVLDWSRASDKPPTLQGHHASNAKHPACARHPRWQDEDLVITTTPEGGTVQRRPLPTPMESMPRPYPFGLVGGDPICQDAMHHLYAKCSYINDLYQIDFLEADQPAPMINMVQIQTDLADDTLHTILVESP